MNNILKNSDRKYVALLKNEMDIIDKRISEIPEVVAVMSKEEVESCLRRREIASSQKEVLQRISANAQSLVINDNERYLELLKIEMELIEEEVKLVSMPFPRGLNASELSNYLLKREITISINSLLKRLFANTTGLIMN